MAASRDRRSTAGNRMSKVLEEELEDDDFYKTTYGGFEEEEEDGDFKSEQEDSADEVDSDFDNPEEEEDDGEKSEDDKPKRRKKGVSTKAYKEPNPKAKRARFDDDMVLFDEQNLAAPETPSPRRKKASKEKNEGAEEQDDDDIDMQVRKSSRRATAKNSLLTHIRKKERDEEHKKKKENPRKLSIGVRRLTQEELMAEAEKTEKKNVKSLENYLRLEESRKKSMNLNKRSNFDGMATLVSLSMTMHSNISDDREVLDPTEKEDRRVPQEFYVFSDYMAMEEHYDECMKTIPQPRAQPMCPVSKKPARYRDPVTNIPYYDVAALKEIRAVYEAEMSRTLSLTESDAVAPSIKTELVNC